MSDSVKLIIEIPEKMYEQIKDGAGETRYKIPLWLCHSIFYGTPLDDVKAEIDKSQEPYKTSTAYDEGVRFGLMLAYQIIDKYKAESEDK
mgnify:CR=1 FL=1